MVRGPRDRDGPSWDIGRRCLDPLAQVQETEEEVIITADLPFVNKEDIEVTVEENSLKIRAGTKEDIQFEKWGGIHRRISFNSFRKDVKLPAQVNPNKSKGTFRNGVLKVRLKKTEGKKVEIE